MTQERSSSSAAANSVPLSKVMLLKIYRSPVGILKIVRQPDGTFGLCHNETVWEACDTPQAEADNVFCHVTGCDEWDSCPDAGPSDLSEWEYIPS